jgi:hypothetical protein
MEQTLDIGLIRQPFGCRQFIGYVQIGGTESNTDMPRFCARRQSTHGCGPLLVGDFRYVAEVDLFIRHGGERFEFFHLLLRGHNVSVLMGLLFGPR